LSDQTKGVTPALGRQDGLDPRDPGPAGVSLVLRGPKNLKIDKKWNISASRHDSNKISSGLPSPGSPIEDPSLFPWPTGMLCVIMREFSHKISSYSEFWHYHS
jgi:hypothetical protein